MTLARRPPLAAWSSAPPALSVIVAVHRVQGYLRQCLDSILGQSFTDIELIAVDDGSTDHCAAVLDEYAARDPRIRVIHLEHNVGLGPARNVGLDYAAGEYVWFVDGDDWLADGAVRAVVRRLRETGPEVLIVDYARVFWDGRMELNTSAELLRVPTPRPTVTLGEFPRLIEFHTTAWNKVIRRDLLVRTGLRFPVGWYEDIPFHYAVLLQADGLATLDRLCYFYRQRRHGAITRTRSNRHFELFDQYERLFAYLDGAGPPAARLRPAIFERMFWHFFVVQGITERLPAGSRRAFYRRMAEFYRRYLPQGHPKPQSRSDRLKRRLIAANAHRWISLLRLVREAGRGLATLATTTARPAWRATRRVLRLGGVAVKRLYYRVQLRLPLDEKLAVYSAYWDRGYACNPAAIHETAARLVPDVRGVFAVRRSAAATMPPGVARVVTGTFAWYRALARAKWLINNVNFGNFVVKRPGSVHVQTHHGTPLKVMGLDQQFYPLTSHGEDFEALLRRCDRWDFSITSNAHSTEVWERVYPCGYETLEIGYPRNDVLARASAEDVARARAELGIAEGERVVLYAPTHREYQHQFSPLLDVEWLADELGPETVVLLRAHYFHTGPTPTWHPRVRDVSAYPRVEELLLASDALITDYSSVMFDFGVLDRPIAIYAPDWDTYQRTRGVTFDLFAEPPGVVAQSFTDLVDAFRSGAIDDDAAVKARERFRLRFCALDDGYAAQRAVSHIFGVPAVSTPTDAVSTPAGDESTPADDVADAAVGGSALPHPTQRTGDERRDQVEEKQPGA